MGVFYKIFAPTEVAINRALLFRHYLRDFIGPDYIFCGKSARPATRSMFPARTFLENIKEHIYCGCFESIILRENEFRDELTMKPWEYVRVLNEARVRMLIERDESDFDFPSPS